MKDRKRNPDSRKNIVFNIQSIILSVLMAISLVTIIVMGLLLYHRFKLALEKTAVDNTEATVEATVDRLNADLLDIRQILNGANYNVVQQFDISSREFSEQFSLLYETNSDKIQSLALYDPKGNLIASEPVAAEKKNVKVQTQEWYKNAEDAIENIHFSTPHIQELFEDGSYRYQWVVSLSRYVDVNKGETPETGILLLDMKYSVIRDVMKQINDCSGGIYYYLISQDGEMIYHPRGTELNRGLFEENSLETAKYEDGTYEIHSNSQNETVIVGSVAYTGWKMIGVVPESVQAANYKNFRYYVFATVLVLMVMLLEGNQLVSRKISKPIRELDASVKAHEAGGKPDIYIGGSSEIRHLGHSVQKSYEQIEKLMDEIIRQQNERRKSELDALQSQINPHFLYNTLESITWMVEAQENEAAVRMISELAKLLRVSLSRGKTIIPIKDELQHSRSYMNIQLARYKERFKTEFRIEEEIENCCIVKLVIQPILENAIYYGVGNMDEDDGGMIIVSGKKKDEDILITIEDNGMGMREEVLENILTDNSKVPKHGSGVGVINVHSRIRLMFGASGDNVFFFKNRVGKNNNESKDRIFAGDFQCLNFLFGSERSRKTFHFAFAFEDLIGIKMDFASHASLCISHVQAALPVITDSAGRILHRETVEERRFFSLVDGRGERRLVHAERVQIRLSVQKRSVVNVSDVAFRTQTDHIRRFLCI